MGVTEMLSERERLAWQSQDEIDSLRTIAAGHSPRSEAFVHRPAEKTRSRLFLRRLEIDATIGVYDQEKNRVQRVIVDLEFGLNSELACHSDRLDDAVDYARVVARLRKVATQRHYDLVESLAETMARMLQTEFRVPWLELAVAKVEPFPGAEVGIVIERGQRA